MVAGRASGSGNAPGIGSSRFAGKLPAAPGTWAKGFKSVRKPIGASRLWKDGISSRPVSRSTQLPSIRKKKRRNNQHNRQSKDRTWHRRTVLSTRLNRLEFVPHARLNPNYNQFRSVWRWRWFGLGSKRPGRECVTVGGRRFDGTVESSWFFSRRATTSAGAAFEEPYQFIVARRLQRLIVGSVL